MQDTLFQQTTNITQPTNKSRQKQIDALLAKQSVAFKVAYRTFATDYAKNHKTFLIEDINFAYQETALPKPVNDNYRATGGIIQSFVKKGVLVRTGEWKYCRSGARQMPFYRFGKE